MRCVTHSGCAIGLMTVLTACGGGGSGGSPASAATSPPAVATPPAPPPVVTTPQASPKIASATPGETLEGVMACARDAAVRNESGDVTGLTLTAAKTDNNLRILYEAVDTYALDVNGFGGPRVVASDKRSWNGGPYDMFVSAQGDRVQLFRNGPFGSAIFSILGTDQSAGACFFAIGQAPDSAPPEMWSYDGRIDGLARIGARSYRLYGYSAQILPNAGAGGRTAALRLRVVGREAPFGDFHLQAETPLAELTATVELRPDGRLVTGPLTGDGYVGSVTGRLVGAGAANVTGSGGAGAVFTFEVRNAAGDVMFGVIAAEANLI